MDIYTKRTVEFRGKTITFREIPIQEYLDWTDEVGTQAEADVATVLKQGLRLLELTVEESIDFTKWPLSAVTELSKQAIKFHQRGGVDDDLKNSSNGRGVSTPSV